jgi:hypothetical protein
MLGAAKLANGSAGSPSLRFTSDANTGMYRGGTDILGFSTAGTERMTISAAGVVNIAGSLTVAGSAVGGIASLAADSTPQLGGDLDVNGNKITSASNADITIEPNGTGDILLYSDKMIVGDSSANWEIAHRTTTNSLLRFQSGGNVQLIADDAIYLNSGEGGSNALIRLKADKTQVGNNNVDHVLTTTGTGDLTLSTNNGTNAGTIVLADGANNDITLTPNGTGDLVLDGLKWPQADGTANYVLKTDGSAQLSWTEMSSGGATAIDGLSDAKSQDLSIGLGANALYSATSGQASSNIAVGANAGYSITIADNNTLVGIRAGSDINANDNVAVGYQAFRRGTGSYNTAVGPYAGEGVSGQSSGASNTYVGYKAGFAYTTGTRNIAIGANAYDAANDESDNIAIGYDALGGAVAGGEKNVVIGNYAGDAITSSDHNILVGYQAGTAITTGNNHVMIGHTAGAGITNQATGVFVGYRAGFGSTGWSDTLIGSQTGTYSGGYNTVVGHNAMTAGTGTGNVFVGWDSGLGVASNAAHANVGLGKSALKVLTTGASNIAIGQLAGDNITSGSNNVVIGKADVTATSSDQLSISSGDGGVTWVTGNSSGVVDFPSGLTNNGSAIESAFETITDVTIGSGTSGTTSGIYFGANNEAGVVAGEVSSQSVASNGYIELMNCDLDTESGSSGLQTIELTVQIQDETNNNVESFKALVQGIEKSVLGTTVREVNYTEWAVIYTPTNRIGQLEADYDSSDDTIRIRYKHTQSSTATLTATFYAVTMGNNT